MEAVTHISITYIARKVTVAGNRLHIDLSNIRSVTNDPWMDLDFRDICPQIRSTSSILYLGERRTKLVCLRRVQYWKMTGTNIIGMRI